VIPSSRQNVSRSRDQIGGDVDRIGAIDQVGDDVELGDRHQVELGDAIDWREAAARLEAMHPGRWRVALGDGLDVDEDLDLDDLIDRDLGIDLDTLIDLPGARP